MANRNIVAIGTSAGGLDALRQLVRGLKPDLPASVLIVLHLPSDYRSELDHILDQEGHLPAAFAQDGEPVALSRIYIAPPGRHLLLDSDRLVLGSGPRENFSRPAIDPLFRSVALCCGSRAIGVVLTGTQGDGSSGLRALKQCGGVAVVQNPRDARFPEMPEQALKWVEADHVVNLAGLPDLVNRLVHEPAGGASAVPQQLRYEFEIAKTGHGGVPVLDRFGARSVFTCPECNGSMWEIDEANLIRYRCHVGHAYTAELMSLALDETLQRALGTALRTLDDRVAMARRLEERAKASSLDNVARSWANTRRAAEEEGKTIRAAIKHAEAIASDAIREKETAG